MNGRRNGYWAIAKGMLILGTIILALKAIDAYLGLLLDRIATLLK